MKHLYITTALALLAAGCNTGESSKEISTDITATVDVTSPGDRIPEDFIGLSFETGSVRINNAHTKGYFFSADNSQSLNVFKELGIRHLRVGGGSVDTNPTVPTRQDIDEFFGFARKSGVKVIYSFRLLNGDLENEVETAKYVYDNYKDCIECFAVGNEPDWDSYHRPDPEIKDYPTYLAKWTKFAEAIKAEIPEIRFTGPNTGSNYPVAGAKNTFHDGKSWTLNFAEDWQGKDMLYSLAQHNYVGQDAAELTPQQMIPKIMSSDWNDVQYPALYNTVLKPVNDLGFEYRLQESNSFSSASDGGSNSFSTALFGLDYMNWWARHNCAGVNFHNKQWVLNAPIGMDDSGDFIVNPVGYGIKAFSLSGKGEILPVTVTNSNDRNLEIYASKDGNHVYVTLINKEYGESGFDADVEIKIDGKIKSIKSLTLETPGNDPYSRTASLGGAAIKSTEAWAGKWDECDADNLVFNVDECSARILDILLQ